MGAMADERSGHARRYPFSLCHTRAEVFRMIPDVRRNLAIAAFEKTIEDVQRGLYNGTLSISVEQITNAIGTSGDYDTPVVSPIGAALLLRMLKAGLILQKPGTEHPGVAPDLESYAAVDLRVLPVARDEVESTEDLASVVRARKEAWLARVTHLASHPDEAHPSEVTRALIDRVFVAMYGYGVGGTIELGGVRCHKELHHWVSNKNRRWVDVIVWWMDSTGKRRGDRPFNKGDNRRSRGDNFWEK